MNGSKYFTGDYVQIVSVGDTLSKELIGQIFTVISKNWNMLVLRPHIKSDYGNLHITADAVRMYKSKRARYLEHELTENKPKKKFFI